MKTVLLAGPNPRCSPRQTFEAASTRLQPLTNYQQQKDQQRRSKMSDQENLNPQHSDPQKPIPEQKPGNQPNQPVQQKPQVPGGLPKSPQSEQEKHDEEKRKQA
jgi:hypothetical protein